MINNLIEIQILHKFYCILLLLNCLRPLYKSAFLCDLNIKFTANARNRRIGKMKKQLDLRSINLRMEFISMKAIINPFSIDDVDEKKKKNFDMNQQPV